MGRDARMSEPVRPRAIAIGAGGAIALFVIASFLVRTVPDRLVTLLGGPDGGVDRIGGLRLRYRPPANVNVDAVNTRATVRRDGDVLVLDYPGLTEDMIETVIDPLVRGGLAMREALETDFFERSGLERWDDRLGDRMAVTIDDDQWRPDEGGAVHHVTYLRGPSPEAIEHALGGMTAPPKSSIEYERVEPYAGARDPRPYWRTYLLASELVIDGSMVANATCTSDPNTGRAIVLLDFTHEGGERFCDATGRLVGKKLATVLGGRVRSAPIINSRICGGRASITMGGNNPDDQDREAEALVTVLEQGSLPQGGSIEAQQFYRPANVQLQE